MPYEKKAITPEDIVGALKIIRETCKAYEFCKDCPLYQDNGYDCGLVQDEKPANWEIHQPGTWRAF